MTDIINKLKQAADEAQRALLMVGFDDQAKFVFSDEADLQRRLTALVQSGGEPLAIAQWAPKKFLDRELKVQVLPERQDDYWVSGYIASHWETIRQQFTGADSSTFQEAFGSDY